MMKLLLYTAVAWITAIFLDLFLILVAALALQRASLSLAETGTAIAILLQGVVAVAATSFVLFQTRSLTRIRRLLWVAGFAVVQLGTWAIAAIMVMVAMNR